MFRFALALLLCLPIAGQAGTLTIFDGDFNQANWSQTIISSGIGDSTAQATTQPSGGNPGAFFQVDTHLGLIRNPHTGEIIGAATQVRFDLLYIASAVNSPVTSVFLSFDVKALSANNDVVFGGLISQGGTDQRVLAFNGNPPTPAWQHFTSDDLTQINGPDWTGASGPITFGVFVITSNPGADTYDTSVAIDNFQVVVTTADVPEPATLTLLAAGLAVAPLMRRRKRAACS